MNRVEASEEEIRKLTTQLNDANLKQQLIRQDMTTLSTNLETLTTDIGELNSKFDEGE